MSDGNENMRLLIDLALNWGRKRKSPQTNYIHYCYGSVDPEPHLPIPILENFLFALALLRSKSVENITEAKAILEKLLHFQNQHGPELFRGNFPLYLHEFPACKDRFTGTHAAVVIYWALRGFHHILGQELKKSLEQALLSAVKHAAKTHAEKAAPYPIAIKIAALKTAAGRLLGDTSLESRGLELLASLNEDNSHWYSPASLGEILTALTMVYPKLSESPWQRFWIHLEATWHGQTAGYVGPALKEWQRGEEPQATLYDLFLGYYSGGFSERALKDNPSHLFAALIPPSESPFHARPCQIEGTVDGVKWHLYHAERFAYSAIESGKIEIIPTLEKGFHPLRLAWGDRRNTHTFVCQTNSAQTIEFAFSENEIVMDFNLGHTLPDLEDREKSREVAFFFDAHNDVEFLVSGSKASTFRLDEDLLIKSGGATFLLTFSLNEGEGQFLGHRMLGNRPSQIGAKGEFRFNAYDWNVFLRTIRRTNVCRIRARLQCINI